MPATGAIKSRIGSVKNTRQITKAMELVAASKLRKAQEAAQRTALYAKTAREILTHLRHTSETLRAPLYEDRQVKNRLYLVISSDRGLAGAYNSNIFKQFTQRLKEDRTAGVDARVLTVGRQAGRFAARLKDVSTIGSYEDMPDNPDATQLQALISSAVRAFTGGEVDAVELIYTEYVSSIAQETRSQQLLPAGFEDVEVPANISQAEFEPSPEAVLETVTMRLLESQLLQALLASKASEYSMRMMAMHSATDNASDIIEDLTLEMNKARQAYITQELAEITGGAEALN